MPKHASIEDVLSFWFEEITTEHWFKKNDSFDETIRARFEPMVTAALAAQLDDWADTAEGCLALIILMDQFTRNIYRDTPRAFSGDEMALALSLRCVDRDFIRHEDGHWRHFMLMPMMHSEDIGIQDMSLPLFEKYTSKLAHKYAVKNRDIISHFGRFPHRNAMLGRPSSSDENQSLIQPNSSF